MPGKSPRRKGDKGERELVALLRELGLDAYRKVASGSGWPHDMTNAGDLGLVGRPELRLEAKRRKRAWSLLYEALGAANVLFLRDDRRDSWLVVEVLGPECSFVKRMKEEMDAEHNRNGDSLGHNQEGTRGVE